MKEKIVLFASPREGKLVKTHLRIYTELKNRGVNVISVDCRTARVLGPGKIRAKVAKMDGFQEIEFDPSVAACVVSNGIVGNKPCREFVEDLDDMGVYIVNSLDGIETARNKENWDRVCKKHDIPVPKTVLVNSPNELKDVLPEFEFPVVCKTCTGSLGVGVFKIDKPALVKPIFQAMWKLAPDLREDGILVQEFLPNKGDVRTIVVGGQIIGSMKRVAKEGDFRNNFSQGGSVENYTPSWAEEEVIKKAAKWSGCEICGVDHIVAEDGNSYVIEVNSCPGTDGFLTVHPDAIERMADFVLSKCGESTKVRVLGSTEKVDLQEIGEVEALMDLGDRKCCVLDARGVEVDGDWVNFENNGRKFRMRLHDLNTYINNGAYHKVPVVKLDMKLAGTDYQGVPFELMNRENRSTPALISRDFLVGRKYLIDPSRNSTSLRESVEVENLPEELEEPKSYMSDLSDEALVCLFALTQDGKKEDKPITEDSINELLYHGFVDENGKITEEGWAYITDALTIDRLEQLRSGLAGE